MTFARLAAVVVAVGILAACSDPTSNGGRSTNITVGNNFFSPTPNTVPVGQVTFNWSTPSNGHNVTWQTGPAPLPANATTRSSGSFQVTLQAGTYTYHCTLHSGMNGTITAQ